LASLCRLHCTIDILGIQKATAMKEAARRWLLKNKKPNVQ
jgi:hypothetical protein